MTCCSKAKFQSKRKILSGELKRVVSAICYIEQQTLLSVLRQKGTLEANSIVICCWHLNSHFWEMQLFSEWILIVCLDSPKCLLIMHNLPGEFLENSPSVHGRKIFHNFFYHSYVCWICKMCFYHYSFPQ